MQLKSQAVFFAVAGLILQGCAVPQTTPVSHAQMYSTDLTGKAATCSTTLNGVKDGAENAAAMTTGGGGWCGVSVSHDGKPYTAGLLTKPAKFGKVYVHAVGDDTRIDYTPRRPPGVPDSFAVRLIPGDTTIVVSVNTAPSVTK